MSKREKIILIIMALTILYGFYALFLENPSSGKPKLASSENKLESFNKFITNVASLVKGSVSEEETYIIDKIPVKWTKDPLLNTKKEVAFKPANEKPDEVKKGVGARKLDIVYSGFLNMGNRNLAIINGIEYEKGEKLPDGGHIVEEIHPNRVVVGMQGSKKKIIVKLEEMQ
ncbi:MAG: hypothetical protein ACWGNK_12835 [Desulfobacterales bacterium]